MEININIKNQKAEILKHLRSRAEEFLNTIKAKVAENQPNERAKLINEELNSAKEQIIHAVLQQAEKENWPPQDRLEAILMITYCNNVVMLESRNSVRAYEYMDFSRRIGELWDLFCKICFNYPVNDVSIFIPPLFSEVKKKLTDEILAYIDKLNITAEEKAELKKYYEKVWSYISSGEIQLTLDLHFILNEQKFVVDFKSGFGSNEKGNVNRLLLVATIYKSLDENYRCLIFVRSEDNNSYFNRLKASGIWEAYCGNEAYEKIHEFSGYDLKKWIKNNIDWENDFVGEAHEHFSNMKLLDYLKW